MSRALADTPSGRVRGIGLANGVLAFRGIPYAQPPVGRLRFAAPEPAPRWAGVHEAQAFAPAPPQPESDEVDALLGTAAPEPHGEDCLALNVWTPGLAGRRPVLVWVHGGGFSSGATSLPLYDGARLAGEGDVVVVSVGYRVGALGFLHLGAGRSNFGLLDQVAALRWVQGHVAAFGGDPTSITVFGESAGAGSVVALLAMPSARGLFQRAIIQSAAPGGMLAAPEAEARTAKLLGHLGIAAEDRSQLASVPLEALMRAQAAAVADGPHAKGMLFMPVVDGEVLPEAPLRAIAAGAARDVELVIGTTREEMHLFALRGMGDALTDDLLPHVLGAQLASDVSEPAQAARVLVSGYRRILAERGEPAGPAELFYALQTDLGLRFHSVELAAAHARHQPGTRMYLFTWRSPFKAGLLRSCHALDLPFTFGTLGAPGMSEFAGTGPAAEGLSERMRSAWVEFARSGEPAGWPAYESGRRATLELGGECRVLDAPLEEERRLWAGLDWRER